jgi:antitoxin MazE
MDRIISKWGNSLGVRIPLALAKMAGVEEGMSVHIEARKGRIVIEPALYDLAPLLEKMTPENRHESVETGKPVGREEW